MILTWELEEGRAAGNTMKMRGRTGGQGRALGVQKPKTGASTAASTFLEHINNQGRKTLDGRHC